LRFRMGMSRTTVTHFGRLRLHVLPVVVWLAAVACVVVLFHHRAQQFEIMGVAQGQVRQISATADGRLVDVPVRLFEQVRKGQEVARINTVRDNEQLQAELAVVSAEIERLQAQLADTRQRLLDDAANRQAAYIADHRRFAMDVENLRLRILQVKAQIETDRVALDSSQLDQKILLAQDQSGADPSLGYQLQKVDLQRKALEKSIEQNQQLLAELEKNLAQARMRRDEFARRAVAQAPVDTALEVVRKAIKVQEARMAELQARSRPVILRSPIDGVVSQILRRPVRRTGEGVVRQMLRRTGEAVMAGDPILTVSAPKPSEIIAYVSGTKVAGVHKGARVEIIKSNEPLQIAVSEVTYLGPIMEVMPQRLWFAPDIPQWGRPMLIKIPEGMKLIPGEVVGVRVL